MSDAQKRAVDVIINYKRRENLENAKELCNTIRGYSKSEAVSFIASLDYLVETANNFHLGNEEKFESLDFDRFVNYFVYVVDNE